LRLKKNYESNEKFTETAFLDNGFTVETTYNHGIKTLVLQKLNGRVIDRTEYEK